MGQEMLRSIPQHSALPVEEDAAPGVAAVHKLCVSEAAGSALSRRGVERTRTRVLPAASSGKQHPRLILLSAVDAASTRFLNPFSPLPDSFYTADVNTVVRGRGD